MWMKYPAKTNKENMHGPVKSVYVNPVGHAIPVQPLNMPCSTVGYMLQKRTPPLGD